VWQGKVRIGETCRPRYAIELQTATSDTFKITKEETGEILSNFNFRGGDLTVADRIIYRVYVRTLSPFMMKMETGRLRYISRA
jgi:Holliday junction resolvase